jgi:hypothetical protein
MYRAIDREDVGKRVGGREGRPVSASSRSNRGDNSAQASSAGRRTVRGGWSSDTRASGPKNAGIAAA